MSEEKNDKIELSEEAKRNIINWFCVRCKGITEEIDDTKGKIWSLLRELRCLKSLSTMMYMGEEAEEKLAWALCVDPDVKMIDELILEGHEYPFFTEATLYELLGKENARDVLGLMDIIKERIDPMAVR